jgi:hypothetical protein
MPGEDQMIANLRRLMANTRAQIRPGLELGAAVMQADMVATTAYQGMSGATRVSSIAYVADEHNTGASEIQAAYNAAAGRLQGFTGHDGKPSLASAPGPEPQASAIVATVPTDYILDLELENGGEKAFLADAVLQNAPEAFQLLVQALRGGWRL